MSYKIKTTQELFDEFLANLEGQLGQTSPLNEKAFLRVLSAAESGQGSGLYKYAADRVKQNLALTATGDDLDRIGNDNYTPRKQAVAAILTVILTAIDGTIIPVGREFVGDSNGLRYKNQTAETAVSGEVTLTLRCVETGTDGNLDIGNTLSISAQIAGAQTQAEVTAIDTLGVDKESDADYRPRVLFAQRAITGGGNAADYKIWGEAVTGVKTIFPYSGRPADEGISYPGDRTLCIEATTDIDPDGIAPESLIDDVREAVQIDPVTGESRNILGLTAETLWTRSIIRTSFQITIHNFDCPEDSEEDCKNDIIDSLTAYFLQLKPFIAATDLIQEKNNVVTKVAISDYVNDVLKSYGAYATDVTFQYFDGEYYVDPVEDKYTLADNEKAKLGEDPIYV